VWSLDGVRRVLYRLPSLKGAETLFVVEGEEDVDALVALGLVATTIRWVPASGRKRSPTSWWLPRFDRSSYSPTTMRPASNTLRRWPTPCVKAGLTVKVLKLPGLGASGDVSDWIKAGGSVAELLDSAAAAPAPALTGRAASISCPSATCFGSPR